ncbi:ankyrin repeat domain-containing protein 2-like [Haliotis rufescens]|uniref:ankyrin repeat domain-containing protein 2-like n=1 Tax=Haliotis rufescens TaxID=6454 RepID=UPI00201E7700|nr:ankyrin repeat domain-containing protein 2-like [Haliotis rufescens]
MAALSGKMDAYDLLASNGSIPSLTTPQNDNVLHAASQGGNKAIVRKVIDIFDINTRGRNGSTPLMRAVIGGHISVLKFLMSRSADDTLVDNDGLTLLHLACTYGHLDVVKHISDRFDINTKDKAGLTCIMTSVLYGKVAVFEYLQSRDADLLLVDNEGDDALNLALKVDCKQIIEKLSSGRESERNVTPWSALMKADIRRFTPTSDNAHVEVFNRYMEDLVGGFNVSVFDTFNMTKGVRSVDGVHYGPGVNLVKAQIYLNYILELQRQEIWN